MNLKKVKQLYAAFGKIIQIVKPQLKIIGICIPGRTVATHELPYARHYNPLLIRNRS